MTIQDTMSSARQSLGRVAGMARDTDDAERKILEAAQHRMADVERAIAHARQDWLSGDDPEGARYTDLIQEHGQLAQVIASARETLGM